MRFYYFSIFSLIPLAVIYAFGTAILAWIAFRLLSGKRGRWFIVAPLALLVYIGPVAEELWIAYNFGQFCRKDAGLFISKTVEVEGFYNDTGAPLELVRSGSYQFVESPIRYGRGFSRLTAGDPELMRIALETYKKKNPHVDISKENYIRVTIDGLTEVLVYPGKGDSWRITKLDKPTARYHYTFPNNHTPVSYKVTKLEYLVADSQTGEILARQTKYARKAYWFFIGLSAPLMLCPAPGERPNEEQGGSLYNVVLKPVVAK